MSESSQNASQKQQGLQDTGSANIMESLVQEFEQMFTRENLSKNTYLFNRMNNNLEIPLEVIYNERKIKNICQDSQQILNALQATSNVEFLSDKNVIKPKIKNIQNKFIIHNIEEAQQQKFYTFLSENLKDVQRDVAFDRNKCCRIQFKTEEGAQEFSVWLNEQTFDGKKIEAYYEPEDIYISLLQSQNHESKGYNYYGQYNQQYGGSSNPYMNYFYVQYPQNTPANFFYIRRAKQDENYEQKPSSDRGQKQNSNYNPYNNGYQVEMNQEQLAAYYQYQQQLVYYQQYMYQMSQQQQLNQPQNPNQRNNRNNGNQYRKKSSQRSSSAKKHGKNNKSKNNKKNDDPKKNNRKDRSQDKYKNTNNDSYKQNQSQQQAQQAQIKKEKSKIINTLLEDDSDNEQKPKKQNDEQQRVRIDSKEFLDVQKNSEQRQRQKSVDKKPNINSQDYIFEQRANDDFPDLNRPRIDSNVNAINTGIISKKQIINIFKNLQKNNQIKINSSLLKLDENSIPVIEKLAEPKLEFIEPFKVTIRKDSCWSSARQTPRQTPRSTPGYGAIQNKNRDVDNLQPLN